MSKRMLIDAAHPEEIRVAILNGNRLEEFDVEAAIKRQIKGNIYLARVTRVEPSLQAAFVEYGGNRHGFLAFNEIHPDYYRIPVSDREAFKSVYEPRRQDEAAENGADAAPRDHGHAHDREHDREQDHPHEDQHEHDNGDAAEPESDGIEAQTQAAQASDEIIYETLRPDTAESEVADVASAPLAESGSGPAESSQPDEQPRETDDAGQQADYAAAPSDGEQAPGDAPLAREVEVVAQPQTLETVGGDDEESEEAEAPRPRFRSHRHYKIQEVIKRRQIMLVQVTKEERGNKGAALTTYLSLAGRYCVLMPNTPRGGGVSRKITSMQDRRRLKDLMSDLSVPDGMGVIVRTAGSERSKPEIKRDFEYLMRLWDEIRDLTMKSTAPALVYEEGNLIKRSIRDLYSRDIEEVVIDGDDGYRAAKTFMKMLMPSHAKRVKPYRDPSVPLFHRYQAEGQIDAIMSPVVQLRSGGYIVINPTEALVAIDVNSGRATRERNIEETALKTNLEAAEEVARQLRLRDLAGLIVIDFIDMEEGRNNGQVERRVKDSMRHDRARIQIGRISPFGLMELSRQRLRPSVLEASTEPCPHCGGTGHIRSTESTALHILRAIEEEGMRRRTAEVSVAVPTIVALYLLNHKREALSQSERRFGVHVAIGSDDTLMPPAFRLDRGRALTPEEIAALPPALAPLPVDEDDDDIVAEDEEIAESEGGEPAAIAGLPVFTDPDEDSGADASAPRQRDDDRGGERGGRRRNRRHRGEGHGRHEGHRGGGGGERNSHQRPANDDAAPEGESDERAAVVAAEAVREAQINGTVPEGDGPGDNQGDNQGERKRRRRGRRGGRRRRREHGEPGAEGTARASQDGEQSAETGIGNGAGNGGEPSGEWRDEPAREPIAVALAPVMEATDVEDLPETGADHDVDIGSEQPVPPAARPAASPHRAEPPSAAALEPDPAPDAAPEPAGPTRRGWWRRR